MNIHKYLFSLKKKRRGVKPLQTLLPLLKHKEASEMVGVILPRWLHCHRWTVVAAAAESQLVGSCGREEGRSWKAKNSPGFVQGRGNSRDKEKRVGFFFFFFNAVFAFLQLNQYCAKTFQWEHDLESS